MSPRTDADILNLLDSADPRLYDVQTHATGPQGSLPLTDELLKHAPSGDLFGLTQNAGMGWDPATRAYVERRTTEGLSKK